MGIDLTPQQRFEVFGDFDPDQYAHEAQERWGGTEVTQFYEKIKKALHSTSIRLSTPMRSVVHDS